MSELAERAAAYELMHSRNRLAELELEVRGTKKKAQASTAVEDLICNVEQVYVVFLFVKVLDYYAVRSKRIKRNNPLHNDNIARLQKVFCEKQPALCVGRKKPGTCAEKRTHERYNFDLDLFCVLSRSLYVI